MDTPASIGKIVKSNSHVDYVCQVFGPGESATPPAPADYPFGAFVSIHPEGTAVTLVGLIYNTLLMNPDFGSLGPRLSSRAEIEVFSPDYLAETATLVGIFAVGWFDDDGQAFQGVPGLAATVNCSVRRLEESQMRRFHMDRNEQVSLRYAPLLLAQNNPLAAPLLMAVIDQLNGLFPAQRSQLAVLRNNLAWKSIVQPTG